MQINQVNISYVPLEDRLLMRINTFDGAEFRFWLTRTVVARMLAGLAQSEDRAIDHETPQTANPLLGRALAQFDLEASVAGSDFSTQFAANAETYPLGQSPLLVAKLEITGKDEQVSLSLALSSGQALTINLTRRMVASINRLLCNVVKGLDWNLPFCTLKRPLIRLPESETLH